MQRIYKGRICTEKEFGRSDFPYLQDSVRVFFKKKKKLKVVVTPTQFSATLENFDIQKIIESLDINPNLKKKNEDFGLNFDMHFRYLHFTAYFSIY